MLRGRFGDGDGGVHCVVLRFGAGLGPGGLVGLWLNWAGVEVPKVR